MLHERCGRAKLSDGGSGAPRWVLWSAGPSANEASRRWKQPPHWRDLYAGATAVRELVLAQAARATATGRTCVSARTPTTWRRLPSTSATISTGIASIAIATCTTSRLR